MAVSSRRSLTTSSNLRLALVATFVVLVVATFAVAPGAVLAKLSLLVSGVCAQQPTHTFHPAGGQLPLCARETGIYLGLVASSLYLVARGRAKAIRFPPLPVIAVMVALVAIMGADGLNSTAWDFGLPHLYEPNNWLRLATGLGTGVSLATFFLPAVGILLWRDGKQKAVVSGLGDFLPMLLLAGVVALPVGLQPAAGLYPISIVSVLGVVALISALNLLPLVALTGWEQRVADWREAFLPGSVALFLALAELVVLALVRQWLPVPPH
jgi:uncharacterized membrane protein